MTYLKSGQKSDKEKNVLWCDGLKISPAVVTVRNKRPANVVEDSDKDDVAVPKKESTTPKQTCLLRVGQLSVKSKNFL